MIRILCRGEFVLRPALQTRLLPLWGSDDWFELSYMAAPHGIQRTSAVDNTGAEILQLISQGYRDREIAQGLHIAEKTVQKQVAEHAEQA